MEVNQKVKDFFIKLGEDEALRGKLETAAKRQDLAECALLSREAGFNFTQADLECLADFGKAYQNGELSEEQLELVTGGVATAAIIAVILIVSGIFALACAGASAGCLVAAKN